MTELFLTLVLRTRRPIFRSKPGFYLRLSTLVITLMAQVIPYLSFGPILGLAPLPLCALLLLLVVTVPYVAASEVAKRVCSRRMIQA